jgi:parvulin-like peptidyl-prolyl isomerase
MQRRLRQAQDALLADAYGDKVKREVDKIDLDARAKELYAADAAAYRTPETVTLQHIMVSGMWRTREQAREKIEDLYKQAKAGADFLELAQRYSDDSSKTLNGGTLPPIPPSKFNRVTQDAIAKLKVGEMTQPVEDESGFHVFKLVAHQLPEIPKFEDVREKIIASERDRIRKERGDALLQEIRSSPTARTFQAHLDALVIPIDPEILKKAQEAAMKSRESEKK